MPRFESKIFHFIFIIFLLIPVHAFAIPAITCHCFTERTYDPARPAVADPYFLATAQNSFFATSFAVDKGSIVMKKQQGVSSDSLWIAFWLGARSGSDPEALLKEHANGAAWRMVSARLADPSRSMGVRFTEALKRNATDEGLAEAILDELLIRFRFLGQAELSALRKSGATNQQLVLAGLISSKIRQPAGRIYLEVKEGGTSWGSLLQRAKIDPSEIQSEITAMISASI